MTSDELIWTAYCEVPREHRVARTLSDLTPEARLIWLDIAKRNLAAGWTPSQKENP